MAAKNIIRLAARKPGHSPAYLVRVIQAGRLRQKIFSDTRWGGARGALKAARAWRDAVVTAETAAARATHRRIVLRKNTSSGIPGVGRYVIRRTPVWMAFWDDEDGLKRTKSYAVTVYGEDAAREKAIAARREALKRLSGAARPRLIAEPWSGQGEARAGEAKARRKTKPDKPPREPGARRTTPRSTSG
jgi:hypothetical protein